MREAIDVVGRAFAELSSATADAPLRLAVAGRRGDGPTLVMPGYLHEAGALAVKVVSVRSDNRARGLARVLGVVLVIDPSTGEALAAIDAASVTALRTGAASGVATRFLARPDAKVLGIFGAGVQGRAQVEAIRAVRPITHVWVYDPHPERVERFIADTTTPGDDGPVVAAAASPSQAVRDADVICAATTSVVPVFDGSDLRPGVHVNAVGSFTPAMQEVDATTIARASKIVVDSREAALAEAGDLLVAIEQGAIRAADLHAEIGEIVAGRRSGRERADEVTYFKSVGNAVQDAAVGQAIHRRALERGLGVEVDL
jgi:ornithine cyclodeaminase/alanine dehydrogenase-like protein (mu-crystallin family)